MTNGSYSMNLDKTKKEMDLEINGTFTPDKVDQFIKDYNSNVNSINASEYILKLDVKDLELVSPEMVPLLEGCYTLYKDSSFKKVVFEISNNIIVKMQLSRIARKVGLTNTEFVQI